MKNLFSFLFNSRGFINLFTRAISIAQRFSLTPHQLENLLASYIEFLLKFDIIPTFPVTANIVKRYPNTIRKLQAKGAKFAVHGYVHIDYSKLNLTQQENHFKKAISIFKKNKINFTGFRAPYTLWNEDTLKAVSNTGFLWDSSQTLMFEMFNQKDFKKKNWNAYKKVIKMYNPADAVTSISIPKKLTAHNIVEIPLTLPEDEMLVDRLGTKNKEKIKEIINTLFKITYNNGELFSLQVHPERIPLYKPAIENLLKDLRNLNPPVWKSTLEELAEWENEKDKFTAEIKQQETNTYNIELKCSSRATILIRNLTCLPLGRRPNTVERNWFKNYKIIEFLNVGTQRAVSSNLDQNVVAQLAVPLELTAQSNNKPVIGVHKNCSPEFRNFLIREGYIFEIGESGDNYSFYFENIPECDSKNFNERQIITLIEESDAPLIRFGRWPNGAKSALTVTGDIDALTLFDFMARIFETKN